MKAYLAFIIIAGIGFTYAFALGNKHGPNALKLASIEKANAELAGKLAVFEKNDSYDFEREEKAFAERQAEFQNDKGVRVIALTPEEAQAFNRLASE